jgi:hypothetical protein
MMTPPTHPLSVFLSESLYTVKATEAGSLVLLRPMVVDFLRTTGFTIFVSVERGTQVASEDGFECEVRYRVTLCCCGE